MLLLGVTTDYTVFFMSGMRRNLAAGLPRITAARLTTAEFAPIVLAAGLIAAAGTASLAVAKLQLISAFGPGLALTVLMAMVVSLTLAPALSQAPLASVPARVRAGRPQPVPDRRP